MEFDNRSRYNSMLYEIVQLDVINIGVISIDTKIDLFKLEFIFHCPGYIYKP